MNLPYFIAQAPGGAEVELCPYQDGEWFAETVFRVEGDDDHEGGSEVSWVVRLPWGAWALACGDVSGTAGGRDYISEGRLYDLTPQDAANWLTLNRVALPDDLAALRAKQPQPTRPRRQAADGPTDDQVARVLQVARALGPTAKLAAIAKTARVRKATAGAILKEHGQARSRRRAG